MTLPTKCIYHVSKWYLKTCRKKTPENFAKSQNRKSNRQNSENQIFEKNGTYVEKYTAGHLRIKFEEFTLIYKATIAKIEFDLLLAVN